jgi:hypothetical protein
MRLYAAICAWLEAHATSMGSDEPQREPQPEGNNFTQAEHAHSYTSEPELHAAYSRQSIDDDQGGVDRMRPIGFRRN